VDRRRPDVPSLVAGLAIIVFGAALLLDRAGALNLRFDAFAPLACALIGAILLASGLARRD
jgi:hypothetical protein